MQNYTPGKTYRTLLSERQGRGFSELEVTEILRQVLLQLAQQHERGMVYGGISPDTLVQNPNTQQPILVQSGGVAAPGYIAPEQLQTGQVSAAGDIYALGITAVVLLTAKNPEVLRNYDGSLNWEDYCVISDQLAAVLGQAVAAQPQNRYANAVQMLQEISAIAPTIISPVRGNFLPPEVASLPVQPPQAAPTEPRGKLAPWQWELIGAGCAAVFGAGGFVMAILLAPKNNPEIVSSSPPQTTPPATNSYSKTPARPENPFDSMAFPQSACGDTPPADPRAYPVDFYPVYVTYSESNLQLVKSQFCLNAYKKVRENGNEAIEVGTFTSRDRAELFQEFMRRKVGFSEIGEARRLEGQNISLSPSIETERVSFAAGSTGATIYGSATANQIKRYLLECGSGQIMRVQIQQGSINVKVVAPDGQAIGTVFNGTTQWQGRLPSNGDYAIEISAPQGSNYTVYVEVL